jgi:CubicO group peptidase (beta-lactamase class C family)
MKSCAALAAVIALGLTAHPDAVPAAPAQALGRLIPRLMEDGEVPGLSIVLIRDSKVVWQRAFGYANADDRLKLTDRTVFEAASLTKPLFAYAVLKLADAGRLSLDAPLEVEAPELAADERARGITARMVLKHTTGFQNEVLPGQTLRIHFAPGDRFSYSGAGFLYLQRFVERITGKGLSVLMDELVFRPLGMRSSGYVWRPEYERLEAFGHDPAGIAMPRRKPREATVATLHTTPLDYARFLIAVMQGTGLRPETARAMLSPQVAIDEGCFTCLTGGTGRMSESLSWGLGWGLERTARGTAFWHWGDNNGEFHNFAMGYPGGDGIVVFTNSGNGHSIMPEIVTAALRGTHPAFAWMGYERYDSPARKLLRDVMSRGPAALDEAAASSISERQLNAIGYVLLRRKRLPEAVAAFQLNVRRFADSWNAHDSLGEAYAAAGEREKAVASYERSLLLNPQNANAAEMLKKLRAPAPPP